MGSAGRPPARPAVVSDVQALERQAVEGLRLERPDIGVMPKPQGEGMVGLPVWRWNKPDP
ncbi:hypothetical protein ACFQ7Z_16160 [Streptomyces virginiae]|uniref:hypothetical protein n=1 Tax=Streptomyces virginiae TaxID=1961 RepID=UPI0036B3DA2F